MQQLEKIIEDFNCQGRYKELISILENELKKPYPLENQLFIKIKLGEAYYSNREFSEALSLAEEILRVAHQYNNQFSIGEIENLLGKIYRIHQKYDFALSHYQKAEKAFKIANNVNGLYKVYHNLGNLYLLLSQFKKAKKYHFQALNYVIEKGDKKEIASSYMNLGSLHFQNGEVDPALNYFHKALELFEEIHDYPNLATIYLNLSETYFVRQDYEKARFNSSRAKDLFFELNNKIGLKLALNASAKTFQAYGQYENAIQEYNKLIELDPEKNSEELYLELGKCYMYENQLNNARIIFQKILKLSNRTDRGVGYAFDFLARINIELKEYSKAKNYYTQLIELLNGIEPKDNRSIAATEGNLGFLYLKSNDFIKALQLFDKATIFFKKKKIYDDLFHLTNNYYMEFIRIKNYNDAESLLLKYLIPAAKKSKSIEDINQYYYELSLIYHLKGKTSEGLKLWEKNQIKNVPIVNYICSFLYNPDLDLSFKKELEKEHETFFKIIDQKLTKQNK